MAALADRATRDGTKRSARYRPEAVVSHSTRQRSVMRRRNGVQLDCCPSPQLPGSGPNPAVAGLAVLVIPGIEPNVGRRPASLLALPLIGGNVRPVGARVLQGKMQPTSSRPSQIH